MAIPRELKEILVCPKCKGELEFHEDRGEIHCRRCKLAFAIRDGIPNFMLGDARPLA